MERKFSPSNAQLFFDRVRGYEVAVRLLGNLEQTPADRTYLLFVLCLGPLGSRWPRDPLCVAKEVNSLLGHSVLFPQSLEGKGSLLQILS